MKLAHPDFHFLINITENAFPVLVLERSDLYYKYVSQISDQAEGIAGPFVLSENWEPIDFGKNAIIVTDLFHIDLNGRKQMAALTKHLNALAVSEHHIQSTLTLQDSICQWAVELENDLPFATVHNESLDVGSLLKTLGMRFDDNTGSLAETICSLIKICAGFLNIRLLILTGLHSVLEEDSLNDIYKTAMYEKISIMDIERYAPEKRLPCEKYYIIDRDMCEIYNDYDQ